MDIRSGLKIIWSNTSRVQMEHGKLVIVIMVLMLFRMYLSDYFVINHDMIIKVNHTIFKVLIV